MLMIQNITNDFFMLISELHRQFVPHGYSAENVEYTNNVPLDHNRWPEGSNAPESVVLARNGNVFGTFIQSQVPVNYKIINGIEISFPGLIERYIADYNFIRN